MTTGWYQQPNLFPTQGGGNMPVPTPPPTNALTDARNNIILVDARNNITIVDARG